MRKKNIDRRSFIKNTTIAGAGFTVVPRHVMGGKGYTSPSDKVNVAIIGVGGKGQSGTDSIASENIVALCDVDWKMAEGQFKKYPKAKRYKDFRKMFDEMANEIDAVVISTPDHTHAIAGLASMELDKHVYIEKPLAHSIAEVRALTEMAKAKPNLITQMGNQGASGEGIRRTQEIYESGVIGEINKVYAWTNRPVWPQGGPLPTEKQRVPDHLDWNLWQGPAKWRDYNEAFLPFAWRGYWDYGTGALGDMGCHILDTPFYILELGYPTSAEASVVQVYSQNWNADYNPDSCPPASKIHLQFPARGSKPPVELVWMDGGILPHRPEELAPDESMGERGGGIIMVGSKGKLMANLYGRNPRILPLVKNEELDIPVTLPRVETSHNMDWINGIKQGYQPSSHLGKAGPLTETVLMGNLAVRAYDHRFPKLGGKENEYEILGRTELLWDGKNMKITNIEEINEFVSRQNPRDF